MPLQPQHFQVATYYRVPSYFGLAQLLKAYDRSRIHNNRQFLTELTISPNGILGSLPQPLVDNYSFVKVTRLEQQIKLILRPFGDCKIKYIGVVICKETLKIKNLLQLQVQLI
jgi:hypothetical protein